MVDQIRNEEIRRMAGLKESVIIKMHKGMLRWFGHVEGMEDERLTRKIYNAKACEKSSRGRPRLIYADQIKRVLSDGKIKSTRDWRKYMKGLMSVEEAKEICKSREKLRSILSAYPARDMA